ncbi:MAG TPA: PAS domain-containing sensor histidine kinase [Rhizomicrobium sp.]|jgi:two-component system nitrogen regulation sensor histidine kinase NtrY|nr:PAS domain-containing sensor histidine kinase [Rhizomicrobium sp.]
MATTNMAGAPERTGLWQVIRAASRPTRLAAAVGLLAVASGVATYATVTGLVPYHPTSAALIALLLSNLVLVLSLGALIVWRLTRLWIDRRSGIAGARLHVRLVAIFSAIAVIPAILVAIFAAVSLDLGLEAWFSARVKAALGNAVHVAQSYVQSNESQIVGDAYEIANNIEHDPELFDANNRVRADMLFTKLAILTKDRGLQAAYIIDSRGRVLGSTKQRFLPDLAPPKPGDIRQASHGTIVIDASSKVGVVRGLIRMQALNDAYLLVVRTVDPRVLAYYQRTVSAVSEYKRLEQNRSQVQLVFAALYGAVSLLILLAAIWLGLWAANSLVRPISRLIGAAERVSHGDLKVRVEAERDDDEMGKLALAFNRMITELDTRRNELVRANQQLDERRRFTEAVLAGVSAGVVGLDRDGIVTIVNRAGARLLNAEPEELEGQHYAEAMPELSAIIRRALHEPVARASGEATVKRGGTMRSLSVQVASEAGAGEAGFIVTFDDITDLVSAQRTAAWADVARRIAHEIKNPLTPIQLSAERLKRKYANEVATDPEVFRQCTDTIIRQVGDIGRMVDEFSSFARMPSPKMRSEIAQELVQETVFLQRTGHPQIDFETAGEMRPIRFECDRRLVSQALINVLKNASEAIEARMAAGSDERGKIVVTTIVESSRVVFSVTDNGIGLPQAQRHRLTEPYVTTRAKGTGLGLAIVRKIVEEHGGEISILDRENDEPGAEVRLGFPLKQKPSRGVELGERNEQERIVDRA